VEPGLTFRFGERNAVRLEYRNNILRNEREGIADREQNAINALLTFPFNIHNTIEVFCEHINWDYDPTIPPEDPRDLDGDEIRGRYTYHFNPITSAFVEYQYYERDFDHETTDFVDYKVHHPRLGFSRDLYENVSVSASAGYAVRNANGRDDEEAFSGRLDFSGQHKRLRADLYGESGFDEDFLNAENRGFSEFWRVGLNGRYQLLERLSAQAFFYRERDHFVDTNRRDKLWNIRCGLSYEPVKWLFVSINYQHNTRDSDRLSQSYTDNRYFFRVTTQYDIAELFQR
jgi:predicted porin